MMLNVVLIKIGACFHLICALSHVVFPKVFKWEENTKELPTAKKTIIWQNLNISNFCMLLFWLMFAFISFTFSRDLLTIPLGKTILTCIVVIWAVRIFGIQPLFGGFKTKESKLRTTFFLAGFLLYLIPWLSVFL